MRSMRAMSVAMNGGRLRSGGRRRLRILIAKAGFALDRLQTLLKGRKPAIGRTAGKIRAPLGALRLRIGAERVANKENPDDC
jgi:hypothetical protein